MVRRLFRAYRDAYAGFTPTLWLLAFTTLINRSGSVVMTYLALWLTESLDYEPKTAALFLLVHGAGAIVGSILGGRLADVVSPHRLQITTLIGAGLGFMLLGVSRHPATIAATLFVAVTLNEAYRPVTVILFAQNSPERSRTRAFALLRLATNLGLTIGPAAGGFLIHRFGYACIFILDGATCFAAGLFAMGISKRLASRPGESPKPADADGKRGARGDRDYLAVLVGVFLIALAFTQLIGPYPLYLSRVCGFSESRIGLIYAVNTLLVVALEMLLIDRLSRFHPLASAAFGAAFLGVGMFLTSCGTSVPWIVACVAIWTIGEIAAISPVATWATNRGSRHGLGRYMAWYSATFSAAFLVGPAAGTAAFDEFGPQAPFIGALMAGALALMIFRRQVRRETHLSSLAGSKLPSGRQSE